MTPPLTPLIDEALRVGILRVEDDTKRIGPNPEVALFVEKIVAVRESPPHPWRDYPAATFVLEGNTEIGTRMKYEYAVGLLWWAVRRKGMVGSA